jgi:hypothetical protein
MTLDLALLRHRRQQAAAVGLRQRAFVARLFASRLAASRPTPIDRVLRRTATSSTVQRLTVHAWMVQSVLPQHHTTVERHLRLETQHSASPSERLLRSPERLHERTLLERLRHHTHTLLQRHATVAPVARALQQQQVSASIDRGAASPARPVASPVPRLTTTLLTTSRTSPAAPPPRTQTVAERDVRGPRSPGLAGEPAVPIVLPAQEMSRVTEHVMQQLDRRFLSYCERTGRT